MADPDDETHDLLTCYASSQVKICQHVLTLDLLELRKPFLTGLLWNFRIGHLQHAEELELQRHLRVHVRKVGGLDDVVDVTLDVGCLLFKKVSVVEYD